MALSAGAVTSGLLGSASLTYQLVGRSATIARELSETQQHLPLVVRPCRPGLRGCIWAQGGACWNSGRCARGGRQGGQPMQAPAPPVPATSALQRPAAAHQASCMERPAGTRSEVSAPPSACPVRRPHAASVTHCRRAPPLNWCRWAACPWPAAPPSPRNCSPCRLTATCPSAAPRRQRRPPQPLRRPRRRRGWRRGAAATPLRREAPQLVAWYHQSPRLASLGLGTLASALACPSFGAARSRVPPAPAHHSVHPFALCHPAPNCCSFCLVTQQVRCLSSPPTLPSPLPTSSCTNCRYTCHFFVLDRGPPAMIPHLPSYQESLVNCMHGCRPCGLTCLPTSFLFPVRSQALRPRGQYQS